MSSVRFWIDPPYEDETWLSFHCRVAQMYGLTRSALLSEFTGRAQVRRWNDWDSWLPEADLKKACEILGVHSDQVPPRRGAFSQKLPVQARLAYCPLCAAEDLSRKVTPYFRWQWALPTTTLCHRHHTPLLCWPPSGRGSLLRWPAQWLRTASAESCLGASDWLLRDVATVEALAAEPDYVEQREQLFAVQTGAISMVARVTPTPAPLAPPPESVFNSIVAFLSYCPSEHGALPLAYQLRPRDTPEWWMGERPRRLPVQAERDPVRAVMTSRSLSWRRTVFWLAARLIWGGSQRVELADGQVMEPGTWESTWAFLEPKGPTEKSRYMAAEARRYLEAHIVASRPF